jgi:ATP-dependent Zn protease
MRFSILSLFGFVSFVQGFLQHHKYNTGNIYYKDNKYPLSRPHYDKFLKYIKNTTNEDDLVEKILERRNYPFSKKYFENFVKRLNSKNITQQNSEILNNDLFNRENNNSSIRIIIGKPLFNFQENGYYTEPEDDFYEKSNKKSNGNKKSDNFEVIVDHDTNFTAVGGYKLIKTELSQCVDLLKNYTKYSKFNVRVPKGLIFEGPPGNGKTLLAKALAGEAKTGFIAVSGSQFQEM